MLREKIFRSKALALGVISTFLFMFIPVEALAQVPAATGSMIGFVYGDDMKTPVENAIVKIRNIKDGKEFESAPTDQNGLYKITNIEEGRYILGITTKEGDFNFEYFILMKANEIAKLSFALKPGVASSIGGKAGDPEKKPFFKTPLGIVILIAASAAVIYGTYKLLVELEVISPSKK
ncbi:MAG: hypothetical protein AB1410_05370 [Acidobacteriota bacterium]